MSARHQPVGSSRALLAPPQYERHGSPGMSALATPVGVSLEGSTLPFVHLSSANQSLSLHDASVGALARLPGPVCTLSVVGSTRDGKSSWLNMYSEWLRSAWPEATRHAPSSFLVEHAAFGTGTLGSWLRVLSSGEEGAFLPRTECRSLALIDTQGMQAQAERGELSMFTLNLLLSSTVVWNVMYQYNEDALEVLRAAFAHVQATLPREPFGRDSPNLVVVLRDARLRMQQAGRSIPPEGLLHAALQPVGDRLDATRTAIVSLFPNRTMFTMRHPESAELAELAEEGLPDQKSAFWKSFEASALKVTSRLTPKLADGVALGGPLLAATARSLAMSASKHGSSDSAALTREALLERGRVTFEAQRARRKARATPHATPAATPTSGT